LAGALGGGHASMLNQGGGPGSGRQSLN
jgi:hypothetical protein